MLLACEAPRTLCAPRLSVSNGRAGDSRKKSRYPDAQPAFSDFVDQPLARYLWEAIEDAMEEWLE